MATTANLYIDAGTDFSTSITVLGSSGNPLDLSGYTVKSQMRKAYTSSKSFDFDAYTSADEPGVIRLELINSVTETITPGRWLYDVEITSPEGRKIRVIEGLVIVSPEITQT